MRLDRIAVIGDGGWGTAFGMLAHDAGCRVTIWGAFPDYVAEQQRTRRNPRFLPGVTIPRGIAYTADLAEAARGADLLVSAVPTPFLRAVTTRLAAAGAGRTPVCSLTKGIENGTLLRPSEILAEVLGKTPVAVLSGPSHAEEVARRIPTTVVVASRHRALAAAVQRRFSGRTFRIYASDDPVGVELGGALKNVIAVAGGICDGLGFGDNTKAALITRGLVELATIGVALGAKRETFMGLAGLGDLITTCVSRHGRNRFVGEAIGRGKTLAAVLRTMKAVPEGVHTVKAVRVLVKRLRVAAPISLAVYRVCYEGASPRREVEALMGRPLGHE